MDEIPVYRVNAYYHAALRSHDCWTVKQQPPPVVQIDELMAFASIDMGQEE